MFWTPSTVTAKRARLTLTGGLAASATGVMASPSTLSARTVVRMMGFTASPLRLVGERLPSPSARTRAGASRAPLDRPPKVSGARHLTYTLRVDRTLVERVREVEELYSLIGDTAKGEGAVALIEGTAGVGKSTLLAQARDRAERDGARVLTARGSELESLFTFGVVRQLFEGVLADKKDAHRARSRAPPPPPRRPSALPATTASPPATSPSPPCTACTGWR